MKCKKKDRLDNIKKLHQISKMTEEELNSLQIEDDFIGRGIRVYKNRHEKSLFVKVKYMIGIDRYEHKKFISEK